MKKITVLYFVLGLTLAACGTPATATPAAEPLVVSANAVIAEGRLVPAQDATLAFQARGSVTELAVKIGDEVMAGDVLARLGGVSDAAVFAAQLELVSAQQSYDEFVRNAPLYTAQAWQSYMESQLQRAAAERRWEGLSLDNIETRIENAQDEVENRLEDLNEAQTKFDSSKDLPEGNFLRQDAESNLENAQEEYNESLRKVETISRERDSVRAALDGALAAEAEAKQTYENSLDGPDRQKFALMVARLNAANAGVNAFALIAPFDGTIMDINITMGDQVGPETWAVKMADTSAWYVETTDLTELEVVKIAIRQTASLVPDALPDANMTGAVESIGQAFILQGGDVLYRVRIIVDEIDPRALWGMTVEVTFEPIQ